MEIPVPHKATVPRLYKYSSLQSDEHVARLRVIIQDHELYFPSLPQLNDPTDGRPRLAPLSEEKMADFLCDKLAERSPHLSETELRHEEDVIHINVRHHGAVTLQRSIVELFNKELEGYRIYSMSKRYDNFSLWAKYAGDHSGYCLEFANDGPLFQHAKDVIYAETLQVDITIREQMNGSWFVCKRPEWSNEEEARLILPRGKGSKLKVEPSWLRRLILGRNISSSNEQTIREWAWQREPELAVVKAHYDPTDQKIVLGP